MVHEPEFITTPPLGIGAEVETNHLSVAERYALLTDWMTQQARRFDELEAEKFHLQSELDPHQQTLGAEIDPEIPAEDHAAHVAYAALSKEILRNRIEKISRDIMRWHYVGLKEDIFQFVRDDLRGVDDPPVRIVSQNPEQGRIRRLTQQRQFKDGRNERHRRTEVKGKISRIDFHPENGGEMVVNDGLGRPWLVAPLIDRNNDYQPAFSLTET